MTEKLFKNFIEADELLSLLNENQPHLKIIDASYGPQPHVFDIYQSNHIKDAVFFDIDDIADHESSFAHTFPNVEIFARKVGDLGIANDDTIIIYAQQNMAMAAARVWWMFKAFGHNNVKILNGSLHAWADKGYPLSSAPVYPVKTTYEATLNKDFVTYTDNILNLVRNETATPTTIIDVRDAVRFHMGHMPTSKNLFFGHFLTPSGALKDIDSLKSLINDLSISPDASIIVSCGSGVTACLGLAVLDELGAKNLSLYDGSWTEYSAQKDAPIKLL